MEVVPATNAIREKRPAVLHVAVLTPPGRGGVATVGVYGPGACAAVSKFFRPAGGRQPGKLPRGRIVFGRWPLMVAGQRIPVTDETPEGEVSAAGETLVVCCHTLEHVEVHCHGGRAAVENIVRSLVSAGCMRVSFSRWVERHEPDRVAAEARLALAEAGTTRTAALLLNQYRGALAQSVRQAIADLDANRLDVVGSRLDQLVVWAEFGRHLTQPWEVVLAGRPNVGKSSLLNALAGYQRALVCEHAGTTRDVLTVRTSVDGWPIELADTAGAAPARDELEMSGMTRGRERIQTSDLVLLVSDVSRPWSVADENLSNIASSRTILVHNKSDLRPIPPSPRPEGIITSAKTGDGLARLLAEIASRLVPESPPAGAAMPFTERQNDRLHSALIWLDQGDLPGVRRELLLLLDDPGRVE